MLARSHYVASYETGHDSFEQRRHIMAVIGYGVPRPAALAEDCPFVRVDMRLLDSGPAYEIWTSPLPVIWQLAAGVRYAVSGDLLFGVVRNEAGDEPGMEHTARIAYERVFGLADSTGMRHVLRSFNYLPRITDMEGGMERYRLFNAGRQDAFMACRRPMEAAPAACALGTKAGAPTIFFLAARAAGRAIENPRQVSAYRYPAQYGHRSPSFSRAMLHRDGQTAQLFVSGTASIVGHESLHAGDAAAQTEETLRNLDAMLGACCDLKLHQADTHMKVYVRQSRDLPAIKARLAGLGDGVGAIYLQADICRPELLVEIEATCVFDASHLR